MKTSSILVNQNENSTDLSEVQPSPVEKPSKKGRRPKKDKALKRNKAAKPGKKKFRSPLANMRIAPKLLAGFLIIAILSAAMGVYASFSLNTVSAASDSMYGNILLPTKNAYDIALSIESQATTIRQALITEKESMRLTYVSSIKNETTTINSGLSTVKSLITEDKMEAYNAFLAVYDVYIKEMTAAIEKLEAGDTQAVKDDLNSFGPLRNAESEAIKAAESLKYEISGQAASIASGNRRQASSVLTITMVGIGVVVALSVLIGIFMARGISRPLRKLTSNIKLLAAGETEFELDSGRGKDEISQMREAIRTIVQVVKDLLEDTGMLIDAAAEGRLSARADAERHTGAYRRIVEGINATLDAMIEPINESAKVLSELDKGNLNVSVTGDFKGDFSLVKDALNSTIATLKTYIGEITFALSEIAQGVLTTSIDSDFKGDFTALKDSFNASVKSFSQVLLEIDTAAEEVALGTAQLSSGSQVISQGAAEQASALEQLTASLSQISEQTRDNVHSAGESNELSQRAQSSAAVGNEKMKELQAAMDDISASSASISKIIKVIDEIAFQTNILALNAAVEAARAGVHGRGFAVVAEEVRNLAQRSAGAAKETTELIEGSITKTEAGAKIADETAAALADIVSGVEKTAALSGQIAQASSDQAVGISQVNKGIEQLSMVVQNNSATAQEAAASSEELLAQAERLKMMVGRFQLSEEKALQ